MKKVYFTAGLLASSVAAFAQLPVSTTTENKNAVLEEFTGIYCTYCPDGHKRAQQFADANPGDVVLINVHVGGYAAPTGNDPDFRTSFGTAIANQSDLEGYPAGTINRRNFPGYEQPYDQAGNYVSGITAQSRGSWATTGATVISETSYVNVALQGTLDVSTRELTVDVEMYFTGTTAPGSVNLNVALMQSGIEGPQTGMSQNPAQVLPNGNYVHNHMLRHLLTGQWGEVITTTTQTTLIQRQYTYTIPADLNGVDFDLGNLSIAAFVAEGQENIITGAEGPLTLTVPSGGTLVDVSAASSMAAPSTYCDGTVTPEITVTNEETATINEYEVSYTVNGGTPVTQMISTPLAGGASATHSFPSVTLNSGSNVIEYMVTATAANDYEGTLSDNAITVPTIYVMSASAFDTDHQEGFESYALGAESVNNAILDKTDGMSIFVVDNGVSSSVSYPLGGFGASDNSIRWDFYTATSGEKGSLVFEKLDFSGSTGNGVKFSHAYAQYQSENDRLKVKVSTDCGVTWTSVFDKAGSNLKTANATTSKFYPQTSQWASNTVDLSAYDGMGEVMIAFEGISAYGNCLYVDDIQMLNGTALSVEESNVNVSLYPNPSNGLVSLNTGDLSGDITIRVINEFGQLVFENISTSASGVQTLDLSELSNGLYLVNIVTEAGTQTERISIVK